MMQPTCLWCGRSFVSCPIRQGTALSQPGGTMIGPSLECPSPTCRCKSGWKYCLISFLSPLFYARMMQEIYPVWLVPILFSNDDVCPREIKGKLLHSVTVWQINRLRIEWLCILCLGRIKQSRKYSLNNQLSLQYQGIFHHWSFTHSQDGAGVASLSLWAANSLWIERNEVDQVSRLVIHMYFYLPVKLTK